MKIRPNTWDAYIAELVLRANEYQLPESMAGQVVVDIGAHIGSFAIACSQRGAKLVASFEADPENFAILEANLTQCEQENPDIEFGIENVAVVGKRLNPIERVSIRKLSNHDGDRGENTGHHDIFGEEEGKIAAIEINQILGEKIFEDGIDLLKIDCEGAEWDIFEYGDFYNVKSIIAELHEVQESTSPRFAKLKGVPLKDLAEAVAAKLRKQGFGVAITSSGNGLAMLKASRDMQVEVVGKKPRVLWIGDAETTTGCGRVTSHIARRLLSKGWDMHVYGLAYTGEPHNQPFPMYPGWGGNVRTRLPQVFSRVRPDIVIAQDDHWNVGIIVDMMAVHNIWAPTVGYIAVDSENVRRDVAGQLRNLRHTICHNEFGINELRKAGFDGRASIAGHGVDTFLYRPYDKQLSREGITTKKKKNMADAFIFGAVAMNQPRKRLDLTVAYFAEWWKQAGKPDDAYLYIHTNFDEPGQSWDLKQIADHCGIRSQILGPANGQNLLDEAMPVMYSALDCLLSTAEGEGFGLTSLESMACGVPNIAVDCGGMPSWAGDAIFWVKPTQYVFTPNRTNTKRYIVGEQDFVNAMQQMYSNKEMREIYSAKGIALANSQPHNWDWIAAHFDEILHMVLNEQTQAAHADKDVLAEFQ